MNKIYENIDGHDSRNKVKKTEKSGKNRKIKTSLEILSIKLRITFWYTGLIIGITVLFFGTMFYINDYIVRNSVHNRLKKTVEI